MGDEPDHNVTSAPVPFLDEHEVRRHLRMADLVPAMARALADLSAGRVQQPVRTMLPVESRGFFAAMPAYAGALGAKLANGRHAGKGKLFYE